MRFTICLFLILAALVQAQSNIAYEITGTIFEPGTITAYIDDQAVPIPLPGEACLSMVDQRDFDNNSYPDALIANVLACGGNATGNSYFFVSYDGQQFSVSNDFGYTWKEPVIEAWENSFAVYTQSVNLGYNLEDEIITEERHILQNGQAIQIWSRTSEYMPALAEISSKDFEADPYATKTLIYDLNSDGHKDVFTCDLWQHWGLVRCTIDLSITSISVGSCKRIGILESQSNGFHNLVCGAETIFRWDGSDYQ